MAPTPRSDGRLLEDTLVLRYGDEVSLRGRRPAQSAIETCGLFRNMPLALFFPEKKKQNEQLYGYFRKGHLPRSPGEFGTHKKVGLNQTSSVVVVARRSRDESLSH